MNSFSIQAKIIDPQTKETIPTKTKANKKRVDIQKKKKKRKTNLRQKTRNQTN